MTEDTQKQASLRQASAELQRYLSDDIAPLMAAEVLEELIPHPPEYVARVIAHWIQGQMRSPTERVPVSDLVYHSMRKLHQLGEFNLIPVEKMRVYLQGVGRLLVKACPEEERDTLRLQLSRLGESDSVLSARAEFLHREAPAEGTEAPKPESKLGEIEKKAPAPLAPETIDRGARALALLLERLAKIRIPEGLSKAASTPETDLLAQTLATAALESKSDEDLTRHLDQVRQRGIAAPMGQVFRSLGWSLPGWAAAGSESGDVMAAPSGRPLAAMNRIVALAPDAQERAKRWGEMIYAAIEQFNEGRLAQAVSILEVAKHLIADKRPDPSIVGQVLGQAEGAISEAVLKKLVEAPEKHGLVRKVLEFFPSLRPDGLLAGLEDEMRRDRRKVLMSLLECHGAPARALALSRLVNVQSGEVQDPNGYFRRNLATLLRRIPRSSHQGLEEEIALLGSMIARGQPPISAKDAAAALGHVKHPNAERVLADRLRSLESELMQGSGGTDALEMLDRVCAALARHATRLAIRAIATHAFKKSPALGDTMARFENLSWIDLSVDGEQLAQLVKTIRDLMPSKMMGFVKRSHHDLECLIQAVSGTPTQEVRAVLDEIATRFRGQPLGETAAKALAKVDPRARSTAPATTEALTGDLDLFGLPALLQSLGAQALSGELVLFDRRSIRQASIVLAEGRVAHSEAGRLKDAAAVYAVMERPFPGTFAFRAAEPGKAAPVRSAIDAMSLILEGARRHDEYRQALAIAPDGLRLEPGGVDAMRPEDETDEEFTRAVWDRAAAGMTPEACENDIIVDPFRVRRLYAHWLETGALRVRVDAPTA